MRLTKLLKLAARALDGEVSVTSISELKPMFVACFGSTRGRFDSVRIEWQNREAEHSSVHRYDASGVVPMIAGGSQNRHFRFTEPAGTSVPMISVLLVYCARSVPRQLTLGATPSPRVCRFAP